MTLSSVAIQIMPESRPAIPSWMGEVVRARTVVLQAHTHQMLGTFGGQGNGDYYGELQRAIAVITNYATPLGLSPASLLVRLDGLYGDAATLFDVLSTGLGVIARSRAYLCWLHNLSVLYRRVSCTARNSHLDSLAELVRTFATHDQSFPEFALEPGQFLQGHSLR